jgi:hypothetical protein
MKEKSMMSSASLRVAVALACLGSTAVASAQQIDTVVTDNPKISRASCAEVVWEKELLERYPRIADACQEVVISDGNKWARFTGQFLESNRDGSVRTTIDDRRGRSMGQLTLMPAPEQRVLIDGKRVRFSDLVHRQQLNLYMAEGRFAVATEPGVPLEQTARILPDSPVQVGAAQSATVASVRPVNDHEANADTAMLPDTAGPLPWLAVTGLLSLLAGLGLTLGSRFGGRKSC